MYNRIVTWCILIYLCNGVTFAQNTTDGTADPVSSSSSNSGDSGQVSRGNGNGHEDHWSSLTIEQQSYILHAYFAGNVPMDIQMCDRAEECSSSTRCDETWKLCVPKQSPHFPKTDGFCGKDSDCKPMYRCGATNKCHLTGPMACKSHSDCLLIPGIEFSCLERPLQVPGKRCWRKCSVSRDCLECDQISSGLQASDFQETDDLSSCRIPQAFLHAVICLDAFCSKNLTAIT